MTKPRSTTKSLKLAARHRTIEASATAQVTAAGKTPASPAGGNKARFNPLPSTHTNNRRRK